MKSYIIKVTDYISNSYVVSRDNDTVMYFESHDEAKHHAQANLNLYHSFEVIEFVICDECGHRGFAENTFNVADKILCDCCYYDEGE